MECTMTRKIPWQLQQLHPGWVGGCPYVTYKRDETHTCQVYMVVVGLQLTVQGQERYLGNCNSFIEAEWGGGVI